MTMPFDITNRAWLQTTLGGRKNLAWNKPQQRWEIARTHLWTLAPALADRFGEVEVLLEFNSTERCSDSCRTATNPVHDCVCSCLGKYHGGRGEERNWIPVGPHRLLSRDDDPQRVHFLIRPGDMPAPPPSAPNNSPTPTAVTPETAATPPPATPHDPTPPTTRKPAPPRPAPPPPAPATPARDELPPGCGPALFTAFLLLFSFLALAVSPWFWAGTVLLLVGGMALLAEQHGL
ncbi:hypothetical protein [Nocardia brasiliensis]|uniref:hypothetical protein n=1 Tax=Nocardia brasiliensis TaxID=37326 RepID=UPI003D8E22FB